MNNHIFENSRKSIAVKLSFITGIVVLILLIVNGVIFLRLESNLITLIFDEYVQKMDAAIEEQATQRKTEFKENVALHAKVIGNAAATFIYGFDKASLERMLEAYIALPELKAVKVFDENGEPFFSIWKDSEIHIKRIIPDDVELNEELSGIADSHWKEEKVGSVQIFLTDKPLNDQMMTRKQNAKTGVSNFRILVDKKVDQSIWIQITTIVVVVIILIIAIVLTLKLMAIRHLKTLSDTIIRVERDGDFSQQLSIRSLDEIGQAGIAFNSLVGSLHSTITDVNRVMDAVSQGDLSQSVEMNKKGELLQMSSVLNKSIELLGQTLFQVSQSSLQVNSSAKELTNTSQTLANGSSEQAASLEQTTSSINEIESQTKANNDNAEQAQQLASKTLEIVTNSNLQMQQMLNAMAEIDSTSSDVAKIIKIIDEIAFQTNLLALNAAVEAARAGKYGKGFAVVAEEVRNLASRSAEAARNTTELIERSTGQVKNGVSNADKTAKMLKEINESVMRVNDVAAEIAAASAEQTKEINEINLGLTSINQIVQQNSSISEQAASAAEILASQAIKLQQLIGEFTLKESSDIDQLVLNPPENDSYPGLKQVRLIEA